MWSRSCRLSSAFCLLSVLLVIGCVEKRSPEPPLAEKIPKENSLNGKTWTDNYFWLRERNSEKVLAYLQAENDYTAAMMAHTEAFQDSLYNEILSRILETDLSVPYFYNGYYYYSRTEEGLQYEIECRKQRSLDAPEEVMLDVNKLADGYEFMSVLELEVSPDNRLLAYSVDTTGRETYTIRFKDLETGEPLADLIPNTGGSVEWANDSKTVFYTVEDEALRPYRLYRHTLGADPARAQLVFEEPDDKFFLSLSKSKSDRYLFLSLGSYTTSEAHYLDADKPGGSFSVIWPRRAGIEYDVDHHGDYFYILNNNNALNFKIDRVPTVKPDTITIEPFIAHDSTVKLDGLTVFRDQFAISGRQGGFQQIWLYDLKSGERTQLPVDEAVHSISPVANPDFNATTLRYQYTTYVTPRSIFDYSFADGTTELLKRDTVLGGYDPTQFVQELVFATAADGAKVPISMVYKKSLDRSTPQPTRLYAYGAYGLSEDPGFGSLRLSLLNRGMILATAHVRGGGEMGRQWYEDGRLLHKRNTFTDFIACSEHLIKEGYTSSDKLACSGGSAGGLLIGAVVNIRPDLYKVAIADVPFVDVINTMLDESIPLTVTEWEQWGNPKERVFFDYMWSYSPYDNVTAQAYPAMLVEAGLNDPRVQYWEPAKWVAKLRATRTNHSVLLLKTNMGAGHMGSSGRYEYYEDVAFSYAFMLDQLGLAK